MPGGRKGKYEDWLTEDGLTTIEGWARDGLADKQIAINKIGVAEQTFSEWKARFPELREALKKGHAPVDTRVENQLLKSALGYTVTLKKPIKVKTKKTKPGTGTVEEETVVYADEEVYIAPVPAAMLFWLKNRRPYKWRDKHEIIQENPNDDPLMELLGDLDEQSKADE